MTVLGDCDCDICRSAVGVGWRGLFLVVVECCSRLFSIGLQGLVLCLLGVLRRVSWCFVRLETPSIAGQAYGGLDVG